MASNSEYEQQQFFEQNESELKPIKNNSFFAPPPAYNYSEILLKNYIDYKLRNPDTHIKDNGLEALIKYNDLKRCGGHN